MKFASSGDWEFLQTIVDIFPAECKCGLRERQQEQQQQLEKRWKVISPPLVWHQSRLDTRRKELGCHCRLSGWTTRTLRIRNQNLKHLFAPLTRTTGDPILTVFDP